MSILLKRPLLYRESRDDQAGRINVELDKARETHALKSIRAIIRNMDMQRLIGKEFDRADAVLEIHRQIKAHGVHKKYFEAANTMIQTDLFNKEAD